MKQAKTNAMRMLDTAHVAYTCHTYECKDGKIDGVSVANKLGQDPNQVFKTLVTKGHGGGYFVFVLPVTCELDLKAAARAVGEKSVHMIAVSEINKVTGYIRGGCSPVGMKKQYPTVFHSSCLALPTIIVSGGRIGCQVEVEPAKLIDLVGGRTADIVE